MNTDLTPEARNEVHWQSWCDWARAHGVSIPDDAEFEQQRARVWEGSEFVALTAAMHPQTLAELMVNGDLGHAREPGTMEQRLRAALAGVTDETGLQKALRLFRRSQMVRIIWRDLAGLASLEETLADLSELADQCLRQSLDLLYPWTCAALGTPCDEQGKPLQLVVLAMGKLGAHELNMSSDIDLIFAFAEEGEVRDGPRALTNSQFFIRLAQALVRALSQQTADGFVFRVDTRLRPFGEAGPLAMSFDAMDEYYQSQARPWERYAMIKARAVTGDDADIAQLMDLLRPFVYRRYLDFGMIEALRSLKQMIAKELYRRGMDANIKLGPGGIREIEFIGQVFQLVRGGRDPDLQIRPIRRVLTLLGDKGRLPRQVVQELDTAYCFLRLVENRLQADRDQQTHVLPKDAAARTRLAHTMNFADWESFAATLQKHRDRVQQHFDAIFAIAPDGSEALPAVPTELASVWQEHGDEAQDQESLRVAGFADPAEARSRLLAFRRTLEHKGLTTRGHERLGQLIPLVLQAVSRSSEHPDLALARILHLLESVARRTSYLAMLVERPDILTQLAHLAGMSPWFTDRIARHPLLLDELLDPRRLFAPLHRQELGQELDAMLASVDADDLEQQMERLHQFTQGNLLRVAAADLTEVIPLMVVSDYLSEIAEVALDRVLGLAFRHLRQRHGLPEGVAEGETGFLVIGYGKLGGLELGYGSDLDLVFLHDSESVNAMTSGPKQVSNEQFHARLGQRMIHILTTRTPSGVLYEVDMRLRPDGNKGALVRSLKSFGIYQQESAWTWEHQALVRARPVAGDARLAERFAGIRRDILCRPRDPQQLQREVREMRARMRSHLDRSDADRFDLKQGSGGIADIEFMVQYSVLRWAAEYPELTQWTDNVRLLATLERLALLPGQAAEDLTAAYKALRAAYHRSALQEQPKTIGAEHLRAERDRVQTLWNELMGECD